MRLPEVAYIGAMGSRRTHDDRIKRLQEAGLTDDELARLSSPIGLDLGARTPEETAVSIAAEIIALRWGGDGRGCWRRTARSTTLRRLASRGCGKACLISPRIGDIRVVSADAEVDAQLSEISGSPCGESRRG